MKNHKNTTKAFVSPLSIPIGKPSLPPVSSQRRAPMASASENNANKTARLEAGRSTLNNNTGNSASNSREVLNANLEKSNNGHSNGVIKSLYWESGTGTTAESSIEGLDLIDLAVKGVIVGVSDGIATNPHSEQADDMKDEKNLIMELPIFDGKIMGFVRGYKEKNQLVGRNNFLMHLNKLYEQKGDIDLVLGGHSRGADEGVIGDLACLVATLEALPGNSPFRDRIKNLSIIFADPCPGLFKNDKLGAENIEVKDLMRRLRAQLPNTTVHVTVANSKIDTLNGLTLSEKTEGYVNELGEVLLQSGKDQTEALISESLDGPDTYYAIGRDHCDQIRKGTPANEVLKAHINERLGFETQENFEKKYFEANKEDHRVQDAVLNGTATSEERKSLSTAGFYGPVAALSGCNTLEKDVERAKRNAPNDPVVIRNRRLDPPLVYSKRSQIKM